MSIWWKLNFSSGFLKQTKFDILQDEAPTVQLWLSPLKALNQFLRLLFLSENLASLPTLSFSRFLLLCFCLASLCSSLHVTLSPSLPLLPSALLSPSLPFTYTHAQTHTVCLSLTSLSPLTHSLTHSLSPSRKLSDYLYLALLCVVCLCRQVCLISLAYPW